VIVYLAATVTIVATVGLRLGREIFPTSGAHQFQLRFRAPAGTKFESTERLAGEVLDEIKKAAGADNVDITLGYVGVQPSSYPINTIFLWTGGSQEGVLQVALRAEAPIPLPDFQENLRQRFAQRFPDAQFSFGEMVARASADARLRPGDLLGSGTVGSGCLLEVRDATLGRYLLPGDEVVLRIERLGSLRTPIVARPERVR